MRAVFTNQGGVVQDVLDAFLNGMGFEGTPSVARAWDVAGKSKDEGEEQQWHRHEQDGSRCPGRSLPRGDGRTTLTIPSQGQFLGCLHRADTIQFLVLRCLCFQVCFLGCEGWYEVGRVMDPGRRRHALLIPDRVDYKCGPSSTTGTRSTIFPSPDSTERDK